MGVRNSRNEEAALPSKHKTHLTDVQLEYFRQRILEKRGAVREEIDQLRRQVHEDTARATDDLNHLHHVSEVEHDTQAVLINLAQRLWEALGDALDRIDDKTYGICTVTGKPISLERLEAIPETELSWEAELEAEAQ